VRAAFKGGGPAAVVYDDVLAGEHIRETLAGIRLAGTPEEARPLLAWLASHPNSPEDVLRDLERQASREVLLSLSMNRNLPADLRRALLEHEDEEVRVHANHVYCRMRRH
jgi:hypothetical protein